MSSTSELSNELNELKDEYCNISEKKCENCHYGLEVKNGETGEYIHTCSIDFFRDIVESH